MKRLCQWNCLSKAKRVLASRGPLVREFYNLGAATKHYYSVLWLKMKWHFLHYGFKCLPAMQLKLVLQGQPDFEGHGGLLSFLELPLWSCYGQSLPSFVPESQLTLLRDAGDTIWTIVSPLGLFWAVKSFVCVLPVMYCDPPESLEMGIVS